jgi:hypothetical protein
LRLQFRVPDGSRANQKLTSQLPTSRELIGLVNRSAFVGTDVANFLQADFGPGIVSGWLSSALGDP